MVNRRCPKCQGWCSLIGSYDTEERDMKYELLECEVCFYKRKILLEDVIPPSAS